ncbi:MAG: hypothetical protein PHF35_01255 [Candidatus Moranbacteria bacterium]|nr:hypothetical protein [Candidatus Moranbacteria bacterium]
MKKIITAAALALGVVFLAGCGAKNQPASNSEQSAENQNKTVDQNQGNKFSGSMKDLLAKGGSLKCAYSNSDGKFSSSGTTYVADGKIRSDVTSQAGDSSQTTAHVIIADGWMYSWNEGNASGMKINIEEAQNMPSSGENSPGAPAPAPAENQLDEKMDFDCESWKADDSMFSVPTEVDFVDQSKIMEDMKNKAQQQMPAISCEMCDSIPDAGAKAQCQAACQE